MPASSLRRNLRLCTYDGLVATPIVYLLQPGNFIIAALLVELFHVPPDLYGVIVSLPFWGNFGQAFLMPWVNSWLTPKSVSITFSALQALCWAVLTVSLSFLPTNDPETSGRWFIGIFALSAGVTAFTGVSWTSWIQEWVPVRLRGKYFGIRNRLGQLAQIIFLVLVGQVIHRMTGSVLAFQILLLGAVLLRILSVTLQYKTGQVARVAPKPRTLLTAREQLRALLNTRALLWLIAYGAGWGFAASSFGPFCPLFMYKELGLSVQHVGALVIIASAGGAISFPAWGKLSDRFGGKPVMMFCMIAWQLQNYIWCVLTPDNTWLLYGMWLFGGMMGAGFVLSLFNLQLKIIPPEAKTMAISVNLAVTSLVTAVAPIIGGTVLRRMLAGNANALDVYHELFFAQATLALLACLLLARVNEPKAGSLTGVAGAMRNIRTLSSVFGLSFFMDYIFIKPQKKK